MKTTKRGAIIVMWVGVGFATPALAESEPKRAPTTMDALPQAARSTVEAEAKRHPIKGLVQETGPDGSVSYEATYKSLVDGKTEVDVAADGALLGKYTKLDEPTGDGP